MSSLLTNRARRMMAAGNTSQFEAKKTVASGFVASVETNAYGVTSRAVVNVGGASVTVPVSFGYTVYPGMSIQLANYGTPSRANWQMVSTGIPAGISGGTIAGPGGGVVGMFDNIWLRNDSYLMVGGDIDLDGNPSGARIEANKCGYFGYNFYNKRSLSLYAADCEDHYAGDIILGPTDQARIEILPAEGTVSVVSDNQKVFEFSPDGNFLRHPLTIGNPVGARINMGEIDNKATFVLRDKSGVAKMVARTDEDEVFVYIGNPPPQSNSMWFDSETGNLSVSGAIYADAFVLTSAGEGGRIESGAILENSGKIEAGVGNNIAVLNGLDPVWRIYAGHATPGSAPFRVNQSGEVWLDNAHVAGAIQVGGEVGGWTIATDYLAKDTGTAATSAGLAPLDYPFYAGATYANRSTAPFRVTPAGAVTASSGTVGGWALSTAYIYQNALLMHSDGYVKAGADNDIAMMSGNDATYRFWAGHATAASAPFRVTKAGAVTATSATITGSVTATSGAVGGWTIGAASLTGGDATLHNTGYLLLGTGNNVVRVDASDAIYRLWVGHAAGGSASFRVTKAGVLTATSATITGNITATSGSITGSLYVGAAAPRIHIDGANKYVESTNYASGSAGFRMEGATGNAEFNNITARGEIATSVFRKGQVVATSGTIYVTRSASIVTEACTATATTFTLKVKKQLNLAPFAAGEIIRIHGEASGTSTWAVVNLGTDGTDHWAYTCYYQSGSDSATYAIGCAVLSYGPAVVASSTIPNAATATATTFTLDVNEIGGAKPFATSSYVLLVEGGSSTVCTIDAGADQGTYWRYTATYVSGSNSNVYNASSPAFALGTTAPSDGRTMITSDATNSPYISIATHAAQPWTTMTEKVRLGNLTGISGASGYGLWTDNGYFTGTVNASAGSIDGFLTLGASGGIYQGSGTAASPTTGLKIWNDSGTGRIAGYNGSTVQWYADTDGKLYAGAGDVRIDSNGITLEQGTSTPNKITWINPSRSDIVVGELYSQDQSALSGVTSAYLLAQGTYYTGKVITAAISALLATSIPSGGVGSAESSHLYVVADATGSAGGYIELAPTNITVMTVGESGLVDINGYLDVDQSSETRAVPVLKLDQADVSEEMIEFASTAGTGNAIEAVGGKTLTTTAFIKVTVNGDTRYIPVGTIA